METRPSISAAITTYNRRAQVCRAIDSVLKQSEPVNEIVVVDDGSTDGTEDLVGSTYGSAVRYVRQENTGVSGARRRAVEEARCDWVAFLDSDDEWTPDRNRKFVELLRDLPSDVGWAFGDTQVVRDGGVSGTVFRTYAGTIDHGPRIVEDAMTVQTPFQLGLIQSSVYRRSSLLSVNCFSENLNHSEDFLVGVQVACKYRIAILPDIVTRLYRTSDLQASSQDEGHRNGPDYCRARMMAYRQIIEAGRAHPYGEWYGESARALCQIRVARGESIRGLVGEQFRYGVTPKAVLFGAAALFGRVGIHAWCVLTNELRRRQGKTSAADAPQSLI